MSLKYAKKYLGFLLITLFMSNSVLAQNNEDLDSLVSDTKNDLLVVVGGGLAGAILGLSTLSFVDEPKDHTDNIIVGASLGIIGGVVFVALSQATKTQDLLYGGEEYQEQASLNSIKSFDTKARTSWHSESFIASNSAKPRLNQISYSFKF